MRLSFLLVSSYALGISLQAAEDHLPLPPPPPPPPPCCCCAESNAAANKLLTASALPNVSETDEAAAALQALVDNNTTTCFQLHSAAPANASGSSQPSWAQVDLNYVGTVGSVAVAAGAGMSPGLSGRVHVTQTAEEPPSDGNACSTDAMALQAGEWMASSCNKAGR